MPKPEGGEAPGELLQPLRSLLAEGGGPPRRASGLRPSLPFLCQWVLQEADGSHSYRIKRAHLKCRNRHTTAPRATADHSQDKGWQLLAHVPRSTIPQITKHRQRRPGSCSAARSSAVLQGAHRDTCSWMKSLSHVAHPNRPHERHPFLCVTDTESHRDGGQPAGRRNTEQGEEAGWQRAQQGRCGVGVRTG